MQAALRRPRAAPGSCERSACGCLHPSKLVPGKVDAGTVYNAEHPQGAVILEDGKIVIDPTAAHEELPTQEGFFFGGTDYDEWYIQDLQDTVSIIDRVLKMDDEWDFEYQSSWGELFSVLEKSGKECR